MAKLWVFAIAAIIFIGPIYFVIATLIGLYKNYNIASQIGCPIRIVPISPMNPLWIILDTKIIPIVRRLPFGLGDNSFTRYNFRNWELKDRYRSSHEMGDIWCLVTPFKNWVYISDPDSIMSTYKRNNDFPRPEFINDVLQAFGPSIAISQGEAWKNHRRLVTRCFNEQNNRLVWGESLGLANEMLQYWALKDSNSKVDADLRVLSLHVLTRAGFGQSFPFEAAEERDKRRVTSGHAMDAREAIGLILENCIPVALLGPKFLNTLSRFWLPKSLRSLDIACKAFQSHMTSLYEDAKQRHDRGDALDHNLMTLLVQGSQDDSSNGTGLTEAEIYGNMFVVTFAGHDTSALTFVYSIFFLAAHPEIQDWISEEIQAVLQGRNPSELDYNKDFHRLKRCVAIMYETLRLYTIVPTMKWTGEKAAPLIVNGETYVVPAETVVTTSWGAVQTDPRYWGSDSLAWNPRRWIKQTEATSEKPNPGAEEFLDYKRGTFVGWSGGVRDCPGRQFSQAEFVATMAVLFSQYRVGAVNNPGETDKMARYRVLDLIENDTGAVLLTQIMHPERVPLVWRKKN